MQPEGFGSDLVADICHFSHVINPPVGLNGSLDMNTHNRFTSDSIATQKMDYKYIYLIGEELNSLNNTCTCNHCYIQVGL